MSQGSIAESPRREADAGPGDLRHILVVDDDAMVCMAIELHLQRHGFRVTVADGGEEGIHALDRHKIDVMI
ncbi:response regulator, partial [Acinetobacter baumannii]